MQVTTQYFPTCTPVAAASGLTPALSAAVTHAGLIDPYQPTHKMSHADPYTDGTKISRTDPYTNGVKMGRADPYMDGACSDRQP